MISSFKSKALKRLFETGEGRGLNAQHLEKIELILAMLNASDHIEGLDLPSFRLHMLSGDLKGFWAVTVRANWRIIFRYIDGEALDVDLIDYH